MMVTLPDTGGPSPLLMGALIILGVAVLLYAGFWLVKIFGGKVLGGDCSVLCFSCASRFGSVLLLHGRPEGRRSSGA